MTQGLFDEPEQVEPRSAGRDEIAREVRRIARRDHRAEEVKRKASRGPGWPYVPAWHETPAQQPFSKGTT